MEDFDKYLDFLDGKKQEENSKKEEEKVSEANIKDVASDRKEDRKTNDQPATQKREEVKRAEPVKSKTDLEGEKLQAKLLGMELPKVSEDVQKNIKAYTTFLTSLEERAKTPAFQEAAKKLQDCFSPENEKLYAGFLLQHGLINEEQAKAYLKKMIPHDENAKESDFEPTRLDK